MVDLGNSPLLIWEDRPAFEALDRYVSHSINIGQAKDGYVVCDKLVAYRGLGGLSENFGIALNTTTQIVVNYAPKGTTTLAQFKEAIKGIHLVYELAEPIVEDVEAANLSVNVWHNGTEEAITKDGTPSTPLKATIDYDLDYPAQVKSLMQLHTETAALLQQLQSQVSTQSKE